MCGGSEVDALNSGGHEVYFDPVTGIGGVRFKSCRWAWGVQNATLSLTTGVGTTLAKTEVLVYASQNGVCPEYVPYMGQLWNNLGFGPWTIGISTLFQAVLFTSTTSLGDFGGYRLPMMK